MVLLIISIKQKWRSLLRENDLGFFTPLELEKGFFTKTSSIEQYRKSIIDKHNQH